MSGVDTRLCRFSSEKARAPIAGLAALVFLGCLANTQGIQLAQASRLSTPDEFGARRGVRLLPEERDAMRIDLATESFELYTPSTGEIRAGLVWVSPGRSGAPPRQWAQVLDRHGVVWIGANRSGNRRPPPDRVHLSLDAAAHLRASHFDASVPVFVAGFSGGARIASEASLLYPDVFAGGLLIGAADYFRFVRSSDPRWAAWAPTFPEPAPDLLQRARAGGRYVFVTASRDFNRALVRDVYGALVVDGFASAALMEIPDSDHALPSAGCFERSLIELLGKQGSKRLTGVCEPA
jgi:hypothetical protein